MGEKQSEALKLDNETLSLDVAASDLLTLQALNAARLKEVGAVDAAFVSHVINDTPLNFGQGVWLNDSAEGNLRSAVAVSRAANAFTRDEQLGFPAGHGGDGRRAADRSAEPSEQAAAGQES